MSVQERALNWDDTVENDGGEFTLLKPDVYPFVVTKFERARHNGSAKLPPCNKAVISIEVDGGEQGTAHMTENLFLHSKTEGLLCQFFRSVGLRKSGDKFKMDWGKVVGSNGYCKIDNRSWDHNTEKDADGKPKRMTGNQVAKWLDPPEQVEATGYQEGQF